MTVTADPHVPAPGRNPFVAIFDADVCRGGSLAPHRRRIPVHCEEPGAGASWTEALKATGSRLPRFLRGVFAVAERSGSVEQVIADYLGGSRRELAGPSAVLAALLYPLFLIAVAVLMMIGVFLFVIPSFKVIFNDFGVELPGITKSVIIVSDIVLSTWPVLVAVVGLALVASFFIAVSARLPFAAPMLRLLQAIPIVGSASQLAGASEFCILLGMLVRARIPLPEALRLTAAGLRDSNLQQGCLKLARQVENGDSPAYAASILPHFGPRLVQLLRHSSHEKSFAEILRSHGELFAIQAEAQAGIAVVWMQPFLLVFVGLAGGFIVIGLFLPLLKLLNELA